MGYNAKARALLVGLNSNASIAERAARGEIEPDALLQMKPDAGVENIDDRWRKKTEEKLKAEKAAEAEREAAVGRCQLYIPGKDGTEKIVEVRR